MAVRVAVASNDGLKSDVNFGEMERLYIYEFDDINKCFDEVETRAVPGRDHVTGLGYGQAHCVKLGAGMGCQNEEYIISVARLIGDCDYLLLQKIGMKPARILLREGIAVLEKGGSIYESLLLLSSYVAKTGRVLRVEASLSN